MLRAIRNQSLHYTSGNVVKRCEINTTLACKEWFEEKTILCLQYRGTIVSHSVKGYLAIRFQAKSVDKVSLRTVILEVSMQPLAIFDTLADLRILGENDIAQKVDSFSLLERKRLQEYGEMGLIKSMHVLPLFTLTLNSRLDKW
jgi:hypothetical protein